MVAMKLSVKDSKCELDSGVGVCIGEVLMDVDGYYYFWPDHSSHGCWSAQLLQMVANELNDLNKKWDEVISNEFKA